MNIAALSGFRFFERDHCGRFELRFSWAEITGGLGLALALCSFEEHYSLHIRLGWPNIFLKLRFLNRWHHEPHEGMESWGFSWHKSDIHLNWGRRCKIVYMPWSWEWVRSSYLMPDGINWVHELKGWRDWQHPTVTHVNKHFHHSTDLPQWSATYPYRYVLKNGTVQHVDATVRIREMEHRWRWFTWLPWPRRLWRHIDIQFSDEVGERAGSWKGGCVGCSYDMLPDDTPLTCLARMEGERKF